MVTAAVVPDRPSLQGRPSVPVVPERPDPEVVRRVTRRQFTVDYKLRILAEAAACAESQGIGALLRREGLYSSHLTKWRQQQASGGRAALTQPRGRPPVTASLSELTRTQQDNARLSRRLAIAEEIIAVQKKVADLLGLTLAGPPSS